jgi:hypothetical protein
MFGMRKYKRFKEYIDMFRTFGSHNPARVGYHLSCNTKTAGLICYIILHFKILRYINIFCKVIF